MPRASSDRLSVETPGAQIQCTRYGEGPAMVLLHGGPGCYDYFSGSALVDWLAEVHCVWCYDQRGCHDSHSDGPFTIGANVDDLEAIRRFAGVERVSLMGHTAGAVLAVHYAAAHPGHVDRLVLMNPAGLQRGWRDAFEATIRERLTAEQEQELSRLDGEIGRTSDRARRSELYRQRFNVVLPCYVAPHLRERAPTMEHYHHEVNVQVAASIQATYGDPGWRDDLKRFCRPACIIHGRSDPIPWTVVDELSELLPQTKVFPLERCGHFPWLEDPAACRAALVAFFESFR
ncbi:MAG: alpha/beta hydrolase [Dehalococcoidia bacterium]